MTRYRSGPFTIDLAEREVVRDGRSVPLPPKVFDTLAVLVARAGRVVSKDELMREVWPDTFVDEANLTQNIFTLRKALSDPLTDPLSDPEGGRTYIETIPRRGYRFTAPVEPPEAPGVIVEQRETARIVSEEEITVSAPASSPRATLALVAGAAAIATAAAMALASGVFFANRGPDRLDRMQLRRVTASGNVPDAAISPDGRFVAYVVSEEAGYAIRLRQVATTSSLEILPRSETPLRGLTFAPDGERVYYLAGARGESSLFEVSTLGGNPRKVLADVRSPITFAPDGRRFAFIRWLPDAGEQALMISDVDGATPRRLAFRRRPEVIVYGGPSWSPDGERIAMVVNDSFSGPKARLVEVAVDDGAERVIAEGIGPVAMKVVWLPDGEGIIVESDQLWLYSYPGGERRRITNDSAYYDATGISADGRRIGSVQTIQTTDVLVAPGDMAIASGNRFKRVYAGSGYNNSVSWFPDGRLVVLGTADGNTDVWSIGGDGSDPRQLTTDAATDNHAAVCGETIVFTSMREGGSTIWRMDRDGGNQRRLSGPGAHYGTSCAPDGRWFAYHRAGDDSSWSIWRMPVDGGDPMRITTRPSTFPAISPDGRWLACNYLPEHAGPDGWRLAIVAADGSGAVRLLDSVGPPTRRLAWTPDGTHVVFSEQRKGIDLLMRLRADGEGAAEELARFEDARIAAFRWSVDGERVAIVLSREMSNLVVIEDFR